MAKAYVKNSDLAYGWCATCGQIGGYPVLDPYWHVSKSLWLHEHGIGHKVRRVSHTEAWEQYRQDLAENS